MSVWPNDVPAVDNTLSGREGALVCVSMDVEPRYLELLLECLAEVAFPVNPQIYHDAAVVYRYDDGHEESQSTTLVEFPAYAGRLDEVRNALAARGFDPGAVRVTSMLEEIQSDRQPEPAPAGAAYVARYRRKSRAAGGAGV